MKDIIPDYMEDLDENEKLNNAFDEMEMLYRTRCGNVSLATNVTVVEIDKKEKDISKSRNADHKGNYEQS